MPTRIIIIGATGYAGGQLVEILASRADVELVGLFASPGAGSDQAPARSLASVHPRLRGATDLPIEPWISDALSALDANIAFLATPAHISADLAPRLLDAGLLTIDLSGAHRLRDADLHEQRYGFPLAPRAILDRCAYGLPELTRAKIAGADLIACAGCYATAVALELAPLVRAGALDISTIVAVSAVSGASGAGRSASRETNFCEVSLRPYAALSHRHAPEIEQAIGAPIAFTPHIAPFDRGIVATAHARLAPGASAGALVHALQSAYAHEPFVRLLDAGDMPSVAAVAGLDVCDIGFAVDESRGVVCMAAALDNLRKGAAGQAVQCMNIRLGLPETTGLRASAPAQEALA